MLRDIITFLKETETTSLIAILCIINNSFMLYIILELLEKIK